MNAFGKVTKFLVAAFAVTACLSSYAIANEGEINPVAVDVTVEGDQPDATNEGNSPDATVDGNQPDANVEGNQPDATLYEYKHEAIEEPPFDGKLYISLCSSIPSSKFLSREDKKINMEVVESRMEAIVERIINHESKKKWETDCKNIVACLKSARPIELPQDVAQDLGNLESGPLPKTLIQQLAKSFTEDLMQRKFGRMPDSPISIFRTPRSIWLKKYKNIKNYVIEALKTPKVLEV